MRQTEIKFVIELDDQNVPSKILWDASDKNPRGLEETKAMCLSLWDATHNNTLKIDLWGKEMPTLEMKRFYIETIGGLAESLRNATGDETIYTEIDDLCKRLGKYLEKESKEAEV
jgi:gliding motility-associated protein GldC